MDAATFVEELTAALRALNRSLEIELVEDELTVDGEIALRQDLFLNVFYNADTNKIAFALIQNQDRIWGIDRDNVRDWHLHPLHDTSKHEPIASQTVSEIIDQLKQVLQVLENNGN